MKIDSYERKVITKHLFSDIQEYILEEPEDTQLFPDPSSLLLSWEGLGRWVSVTNPALGSRNSNSCQAQPILPSMPRTGSDCEILQAFQCWGRVEPAIPQTKCLPSLKAME